MGLYVSYALPGPAVAECASRAGAGVVLTLTALHLNGGGAMRLENQAALAQTVVAGDRSYAGPLAGVPLGLPVFHVFEPEVRDQVPGDVYEAQVALM